MNKRQLMDLLRSGYAIDACALDDTEYRGTSLGLPRFVERLTWKRFKKVFYRDRQTGRLRGWNVRLEQNSLEEPCLPKLRDGEPVTFGHYEVVAPSGHRVPRGCDRGLLIHYGLGENPRLDPIRRVRDPIVAVEAGSTRILLGWSYIDLGVGCIGTPSFFTLEHDGPLTHAVPPVVGSAS